MKKKLSLIACLLSKKSYFGLKKLLLPIFLLDFDLFIGNRETSLKTVLERSKLLYKLVGPKARYKNGFGGNFSLLGWGRLPLKNRLLFFSIHSLIVDKPS